MYRTLGLAACLAFVACKEATPTPSDTDTGTPTPACETVSGQFPPDMAPAVYYRTSFSWNFTNADTSAAVTLTGPNGAITGTDAWVGNTLVWTPDTPLTPSTSYTLSLSSCDGVNVADSTFMTSAVGAPATDTDLPGNTYLLDLTDPAVVFIEPPGVGALLQQQLDGVSVLVNVVAVTGTDIDMIGAIGDGEGANLVQDQCTPSIPFPPADFSENPYFEIGPEDTTISVAGFDVSIDNLKISGAFAPDASVISGAVLEGKVDTRPLVALLAPDGGPDAVCTLVGQFGIACEDCANGETFCLSLKVNNINAQQLPGVVVEEIVQADIDANTACTP